MKILVKGKLIRPNTYVIYLDKGNYEIILDVANLNAYPKIKSNSSVQNDLSSYYSMHKRGPLKIQKFISEHPNSLASAFILNEACVEGEISTDPKAFLDVYNKLSNDVKKKPYAKEAKMTIDGCIRTTLGADMPEIKGIMPNGKAFDKNLIKGKLTVLAFWASWNESSIKDIPQLKMLYERLHPKGLEIVGIAIDKHEDRWKKAIAYYDLNWLHVADFKGAYSENFEQFNTNKLPDYIIIGPDLKIVDVRVPIESIIIYFNDFIRDSEAK